MERLEFKPELAPVLTNVKEVGFEEVGRFLTLVHGRPVEAAPMRVGVMFSGGPAAGGANVVAGLFDALKGLNGKSKLFGFLGGPSGLLAGKFIEVDEKMLAEKRNTGGFDLLGTGRTKIESEEQFLKALNVIESMQLNGVVFIGGDDTNTNAAHLGEFLQKKGCSSAIVGIPKTIDGDLQTPVIEMSFGFDTACKVFGEIVGNICTDARSSLKYWHLIKVMGRTASHVTLECALMTRPNIALIGEEIGAKQEDLSDVVSSIADVVEKRSKAGKNYGVALIPEGLIEFIPSMKILIKELNGLLAKGRGIEGLSRESKEVFDDFPSEIQNQLLRDRDPHGNVQVSKIETEKFISTMVKKELESRGGSIPFDVQHHFLGYEGRCSWPSNFDATYCYNLGFTAALLVQGRKNGYMAGVRHLARQIQNWEPVGVPIKDMLCDEERKGVVKRVIAKALVDLKGKVFAEFAKNRDQWALEDHYRSPGPIQFFGPHKDLITNTLSLARGGKG